MTSNKLENAMITSLLNENHQSDNQYQISLLRNEKYKKILSTLIAELSTCNEFKISVAFITSSGVNLLIECLKTLEERGISGQIIASDYLYFTDPKAIERLNMFENIEVKLLRESNFHAKMYCFKQKDYWTIIVGSSNLTAPALTKNIEWNTKICAKRDGGYPQQIFEQFDVMWNDAYQYLDIKDEYTEMYHQKHLKNTIKDKLYKQMAMSEKNNLETKITPNKMQSEALKSLENLREQQKNKALIISATGSGKTFLSAFDVAAYNPGKCLFIVHRETIAKKSIDTFKKVIPNAEYGLLTGNKKQFAAKYIFATIQTLSKYYTEFQQDEFDYIIIDEVHHGGAKTYQKIVNYFEPKFLLGMTATPKRTDGFSIFKMFDYNIAAEFTLEQALEQELLAPFHYFGIKDIKIDGQEIDEKTSIQHLSHPIRIKHIVEKLKFYGFSGDKLAGLIFVSSLEEAENLSIALNKYNFSTCSLSGKNTETEREAAINKLEQGKLDYIITVDIFNEGIDIPCVNQIVLLRPTSSVIVYMQQIGRGLRKYKNKEFVVIIDFIANYKQNYLIPLAFSSNHPYDKDVLKKDILLHGIDYLTGESVIQFEEIVQKEIMAQISQNNFSNLALIRQDYNYLKEKLAYIPSLEDFQREAVIDPQIILNKYNYFEIIEKFEKTSFDFSCEETLYLDFFRRILLPFKRVHEFEIINNLLINEHINIHKLNQLIEKKYNIKDQTCVTINAVKHLERTIFTSYSSEKKFLPLINRIKDEIYFTEKFNRALNKGEFKQQIIDLLKLGINKFKQENYDLQQCLTINQTYTKREAFKYALLDYSNGYQVAGYTFVKDQLMIFITLDNTNVSTIYDNEFLDKQTITWFSKENRRLKYTDGSLSKEGKILNGEYDLHIFVKKISSEQFYYLGMASRVIDTLETISYQKKPVIKYTLELMAPVEERLYSYLTFKEASR